VKHNFPEGQNTEPSAGFKYVGFWVRFLAFVVDSIAIMILLAIVAMFIPVSSEPGTDLSSLEEVQGAILLALPRMGLDALLSALVFLLLWNYIRSSLGKLIFKAYILDKSGRKASFTQLLVRYFGYFISLACFGLGFLWIAFDPKKQGWHDKMAGTIVVYNND